MTSRTVKFDKSIYSKRAVQESIKEYADIAKFNFAESESDYICRIIHSIYPVNITILEFSNYVLGITVQAERHEDVD